MKNNFLSYSLLALVALSIGAMLACHRPAATNPAQPGVSPTPNTNTPQLTMQRVATLVPIEGKAVYQIAVLLNQEKRPSGEPYLSNQGLLEIKDKLKLTLEDAKVISDKLDGVQAGPPEAQKIIDCTLDVLRLLNGLNAIAALPANFKSSLGLVVEWGEQLAASAKLLLPLLQKKSLDPAATLTLPANEKLDLRIRRQASERDLQSLLIGFGILAADTVNQTRLVLQETSVTALINMRKQAYDALLPMLK